MSLRFTLLLPREKLYILAGSFLYRVACSTCACMDFLWALHLLPTVQKHVSRVNGWLHCPLDVSMCGCMSLCGLFMKWQAVQSLHRFCFFSNWDRLQQLWDTLKAGMEDGWNLTHFFSPIVWYAFKEKKVFFVTHFREVEANSATSAPSASSIPKKTICSLVLLVICLFVLVYVHCYLCLRW